MPAEQVIEEILQICKRFSAKKVILYGSRAKGTHLKKSDIDIAVSGICDFGDFSESIDKIKTLYTIDLLNLDACKNQSLLEDIKSYGKKYMKRFESYQRSLRALSEARERDMQDSFVLSGTGAKFGITFELAWKFMKDILIQHYAITNFVTGSPKEVLKQSFKADLIEDPAWLQMLSVRNELTYDYDETSIKTWCEEIRGRFLDLFFEFEQKVLTLLETS
ncbi:MAG: hypothetical protein HFI82_10010 [Eubacterium sp.]|jgi:nucleotidyltransferase substrate binding protein (TIGR01987 family)|nr:hypothetical protein [Eubacterium sp.]